MNRPVEQLNGEKNVSAPARPDPLNPRVLATHDASLVELAAAPRQPWLNRRTGVPRGKVSKHSIQSQILNQARSIAVYTPPNFPQQDKPYRLLILFDGEDFQRPEQIPGPTILDNLLSERKIHPTLVVFVNQIDRDKELACSEGFAEFVAVELLPWIQSRYDLGTGPKRTIIGGSSLGGLMASYCAFRHSDKFGNVLSLSGAYHWLPSADEISRNPTWNRPG